MNRRPGVSSVHPRTRTTTEPYVNTPKIKYSSRDTPTLRSGIQQKIEANEASEVLVKQTDTKGAKKSKLNVALTSHYAEKNNKLFNHSFQGLVISCRSLIQIRDESGSGLFSAGSLSHQKEPPS